MFNESKLMRKTLAKDLPNKKLSGVCSGIARYYQCSRLFIRAAAIGCLIIFPVPTGVAYLVAALLLPRGQSRVYL
jgi:phage shock protein PspC (stress-responsive transcriptional regulator)